MSAGRIPATVRRRVAEAAHHRCGYCQTSSHVVGPLLEIDHIVPESRGGTSDESNLWLACPLCNGAKADRTEAPDPETGEAVALFDPRREVWSEHFSWSPDGTMVVGRTASGRATVAALKVNIDDMVATRRLWVAAGWHPPGL
ncbi:MAG: HNH endonuclease [Chloroflexi bacterium CFX7]|nr:HNH endonuclease [Chloroflexi bacterium CFX7]